MKSFIASLLLGPVVATNGAMTLRRLQFLSGGTDGGGNLLSGLIADIVDPNSGGVPAQQRHCKDPLASSCDSTGASGKRDNFQFQYDPDAVTQPTGEFAKAIQAQMEAAGAGIAPTMPSLFGETAASPPAFGQGAPSPPWAAAAATTEGGEAKLTVRQQLQKQFGMEVTADPYGIPAPDAPASPFGAAPAIESPFGAAPASPFEGAASPFEGVAAAFGGGATPPFGAAGANVGSLLRGGVNAHSAATPESQVQETGNMTESQRQRAAAITAAAVTGTSTSTRPQLLPAASPFR